MDAEETRVLVERLFYMVSDVQDRLAKATGADLSTSTLAKVAAVAIKSRA